MQCTIIMMSGGGDKHFKVHILSLEAHQYATDSKLKKINSLILMLFSFLQKPANILVMGEGPERGRVKIGVFPLVLYVGFS